MRNALYFGLIVLSGCIVVDNTNYCTDGRKSGGESDIDCGGACGACANGQRCVVNADCSGGTCASGICGRPTVGGSAIPDTNNRTYAILNGAGISLNPGEQAGYFMTSNVGGAYRIFWTGDSKNSGLYREFYGSVWTAGKFTKVVPGCAANACPLESADFVSAAYGVTGGQRIDWDSFASDGIDGFDFNTDTEPVVFDFTIDGTRYRDLVFFPAADTNPRGKLSSTADLPFGLISKN
ncbi:MAG: hypothetical protein EXR72_12395 [Myxococcales bacterium]|nr:hypothetical protein [Myxococcales bacterium]